MKFIETSSLVLITLTVVACHTSKKSVASSVVTTPIAITPSVTVAPVPIGPSMPVKSNTGIFAPGSAELAAMQMKYLNVTLEVLKEGHAIYIGACTNCHNAKNIYKLSESEWPVILDDMAQKSHLSAGEKDAVYKYVLAIKATQPKGGN